MWAVASFGELAQAAKECVWEAWFVHLSFNSDIARPDRVALSHIDAIVSILLMYFSHGSSLSILETTVQRSVSCYPEKSKWLGMLLFRPRLRIAVPWPNEHEYILIQPGSLVFSAACFARLSCFVVLCRGQIILNIFSQLAYITSRASGNSIEDYEVNSARRSPTLFPTYDIC